MSRVVPSLVFSSIIVACSSHNATQQTVGDGGASAGVKIEIFKEGANGALGDLVGAAVTTTADDTADPPLQPLPTWSSKCPPEGCKLRSFRYASVPTETPLIIKTSDAAGTGA